MTRQWQRAWIIGASSGIGKALADALLPEVAEVVISARRQDRLQEIAGQYDTMRPLPLDISADDDPSLTLSAVAPDGNLDLAIFNAALYEPGSLMETSAALHRQIFDVNYFGILQYLQETVSVMAARGGGHIAFVASLAGYRGLPNAGAYGPSKAALINLAEALAAEMRGSNITVSVINPGFVKSELTDKNDFEMPFLMEADQAATHILRGLKARRFEIAFPFAMVWRMKLLRLLPYRLYFSLIQRMTRS